jgi:UDP-glucose 4-epimerase
MAPEPGVMNLRIAAYEALPERMDDAILIHAGELADIAAAEARGEEHGDAMRRMLDTLLARGFAGVIYVSSAAVYGDSIARPRRPDEAIAPNGSYARAKADCEAEVLARGGTVVRLANLFGPGMARNTVVMDVLSQIPGTGALALRDEAPMRDYLWVDDAARAIAAGATRETSGVLNVGTGIGTSAGGLARRALDLAGEGNRPVISTKPSGRVSHLVLDIAATEAALAWSPRMSLECGLTQMLAGAT